MRRIVDGTTVGDGRRGLLVLPRRPGTHEASDPRRDERPRSLTGRQVSLAWGDGITGRVAATREPIAVDDVTQDERFAGSEASTSRPWPGCCRCPLVWHDDVVGVLNVQTRAVHDFDDDRDRVPPDDRRPARRHRREGPADGRGRGASGQLTALDAARAELLSVVTHELRTPLSVVRVYVDLLAEAAVAEPAAGHRPGAPPPTTSSSASIGSSTRSWPRSAARASRAVARTVRRRAGRGRDRRDAASAAPAASDPLGAASRPAGRDRRRQPGSGRSSSSSSRTSRSTRRRREGVSIGIWRVGEEIQVYVTDDGPGVPVEDWESVFEPFVRVDGRGDLARLRDRPVRVASAHVGDGRAGLPRAQRLRRVAIRRRSSRRLIGPTWVADRTRSRSDTQRMVSPFDGAGTPFKGPSWRGPIITFIIIV